MATATEYALIAAGVSLAIIAVVNGTSNPFKAESPSQKFQREWKQACNGKYERDTVFVKNENGVDVQMGCSFSMRR